MWVSLCVSVLCVRKKDKFSWYAKMVVGWGVFGRGNQMDWCPLIAKKVSVLGIF